MKGISFETFWLCLERTKIREKKYAQILLCQGNFLDFPFLPLNVNQNNDLTFSNRCILEKGFQFKASISHMCINTSLTEINLLKCKIKTLNKELLQFISRKKILLYYLES